MTIEQRLAEINSRRAEIRSLLKGDSAVDLDAITAELEALDEEVSGIERRRAVLDGIANGTIETRSMGAAAPAIPAGKTFDRETVLGTPEYRSAWAKTLMCEPLNDVEKRAAGVALSTTATTYVAATASPDVDGVNNGGLLIPESVQMDLLAAIAKVSPLFRDAAKFAIPGTVKFPYRASMTAAAAVTEGTANVDSQIQWAELSLGTAEISETIRVTWKLEKMAVDQFVNYLTQELIEQVTDKVVDQMIYGAGGAAALTGASVGALDVTYGSTDNPIDAIEDALALMSAKLKIGAKLYVSTSIIEKIAFQRNADGGYIFSPVNGAGVNSIATYPVEVDPYLTAGDFIIGNIGRYYKFNTVEPISITKDISGKSRINDYTGYWLCAGAPQPSCLAFGTFA
jgi:HK97 family phage major capsid protein